MTEGKPYTVQRDLPGKAHVAVVGGGIIGLSVAYELSRRGRQVVVVERDRIGYGCTRASGGMIAPVSESDVARPDVLSFGLASLRRFGDLVGELEQLTGQNCGYLPSGSIWIALDRDEEAELEHLREFQRRAGFDAEWLSAKQVLQLEPQLSSRVISGLRLEMEHCIDPYAFAVALAAGISNRHGAICEQQRVSEIAPTRSGQWSVVSDSGSQLCVDQVVIAAGAWSHRALRQPLADPGLRPVKGQALRINAGGLLRSVIRSPRVYLVPRANGDLFVGATSEEQGFDESITTGAVYELTRWGWRALPPLYDLPLAEVVVGFRPAYRDHDPVIGETDHPGLFVATGHYRHGVLLAPATGHFLAEAMTGNAPPELEPFSWQRLQAEQSPTEMNNGENNVA